MEHDSLLLRKEEQDVPNVTSDEYENHLEKTVSSRGVISSISGTFVPFLSSLATLRFWLRVLLMIFIIFTSLSLATLMYWSFYWYYIPKIYHTVPIDFQFGNYPHHKDTLPYAQVVLLQDQFNKDPLDCSVASSNRLLSPNQYYDFTLEFVVPDSSIHDQLGVIMVETKFTSCSNTTVWTSRQPYLFPYRSFLHNLLIFLKRFVPLYFGWCEEIIHVTIPLSRRHIIDQDQSWPISMLYITISNPLVQFYSATLHIDARFKGLQYFMYYWFFTSSFIAIAFLFVLNMILWLVALLTIWRRMKSRNTEYEYTNLQSTADERE